MLSKGNPSDGNNNDGHNGNNINNNNSNSNATHSSPINNYTRGNLSPSNSNQSTRHSHNQNNNSALPPNGTQTSGVGRMKSNGGGAGEVLDLGQGPNDRTAKANRLRTTGKLFDLMSAKSDVDHPLCHECAEMLLESLAKQLRDVSRERDCYIDFLRTVNSNVASDAEMENLENEIKTIQVDEDASIQSLRDIEEQQRVVQEEIAMLEQEALDLDKEEER